MMRKIVYAIANNNGINRLCTHKVNFQTTSLPNNK
jgi:hypothetical protein